MWGRSYTFALTTDGYTLTSDGVDEGVTAYDIIFSNGQQTSFGKFNTNTRGEETTTTAKG